MLWYRKLRAKIWYWYVWRFIAVKPGKDKKDW